MVAARYALQRGWDVAAFLFDITKAYDNIKFDVLIKALSWKLGFDPMLLRLLILMYKAERHVVIGIGIAKSSFPTCSVVAGCAFADVMMLGIMVMVDLMVAKVTDSLCLRAVVADDYQLLIMGTGVAFQERVVEVFDGTRQAFGIARLPLSEKKLNFLASTGRWVSALEARRPDLMRYRTLSARNLGVDFTLRNKRSSKVFAKLF